MDSIIKTNPQKVYIRFYLRKSNKYTYCSVCFNNRTIRSFSSKTYHNDNEITKVQAASRLGNTVAEFILQNNLKGTHIYDLSGMKNHGRLGAVIKPLHNIKLN